MFRNMEGNNNEDELTFVKLAAVTANVVRWLMQVDEEKKEETGRDSNAGKTDEQRTEDERRYIETRLREIRAWEKRQKGI
jgi:hypothetical protein